MENSIIQKHNLNQVGYAEQAPALALAKQGEDAKAGQGLASLLPPAQLAVIQLHSSKSKVLVFVQHQLVVFQLAGDGWIAKEPS